MSRVNNVAYTKHAKERLAQRFPEVMLPGMPPDVSMHRAFSAATLERRMLNDSNFIVKMIEERGDFDYDFYVNGDIVFVVTHNVMVTVMDRRNKGMKKMVGPSRTNRFRKKAAA